MKDWIRGYLGISRLELQLNQQVRLLHEINKKLDSMQLVLTEPINKLATVLLDEHSDARKRASDMIGEEAIKLANAEVKARALTGGQDY